MLFLTLLEWCVKISNGKESYKWSIVIHTWDITYDWKYSQCENSFQMNCEIFIKGPIIDKINMITATVKKGFFKEINILTHRENKVHGENIM